MCNQLCIYCANPRLLKNRQAKATTKKEIIERIEKAANTSDFVCFTGGGEPTMEKKLPYFISYAKKLGIQKVGIETNGMLLCYPEYTQKLKEHGLDYCVVSLHSHKEHISDKITQVKDGFKCTINGLENLKKEKIRIACILHTITKLNYKDLTEFIVFMNKKFGINNFSLSFIRPIETEESKNITPSLTESKIYIHNAFEYSRKNSINVSMSVSYGIPLCFMQGFENLSDELKVFVKQGKDEHKKRSLAQDKIKDKKCNLCSFDRCCSGIPKAYADLYGSNELTPQKIDLNKILFL